jgi:hypothetical protein
MKGDAMPVKLELTHDGYILHYEIADPFEIEELLEAYKQEKELRDNATHTLHALIDFSQVRKIPKNWLAARHGPGMNHRTSGEMVCVGLTPGLKMLLDIIFRLANYKRIRLFDSLDEAQAHITRLVEQTKAAQAAN